MERGEFLCLCNIHRSILLEINRVNLIGCAYFRSYYFSVEELANLFESVGFKNLTCSYVLRRTVNLKENIDVPRIFVQGKFGKP